MRLFIISSEGWRNERYAHYKTLLGPNARLVNSYGLTEATVDSTYYEAADEDELVPERYVPIGRPLANTRVYVVDSNFEPQPIGIPGELCIGGIGVGLGYLNRPELTEARFREDPFSDEPGARLYRTGDLARWLPDGNIEFMGRNDRQLKIRGFRIEPGEIESALEHHPGVRQAAVTVHAGGDGDSRLVAYLELAEPGVPVPVEQLRDLVADALPAYMIPAAWTVVKQIPVTPNGKVDFAALPDPEFDRSAAADEYVAPRTELERKMAEVWCEVLGVERVGIHDNFFALGGHSLLAVKLFTRLDRKLGVKIPLSALFQAATIAGLAELVDETSPSERETSTSWDLAVTLRPGNGERPLFLVSWLGGEVFGYREMAERLDGDTTVIGLRAPGVDHTGLPLATIEALAEHYIQEIRRIQPQGPYRLGGYCFSGLVAYEMAARLLDQGETCELVALIDAYPQGTARRPNRLAIEREKFQALADGNWSQRRAWVKRRATGLRRRISDAVYFTTGRLAYDILAARGGDRVPRGPWRLVLIASSRARRLYTPKPSNVAITFFRAQAEPDNSPTPWEQLALGGVKLRQIIFHNINHESMMHEPHVATLSHQLDQALRDSAAAINRSADNGAQPSSQPKNHYTRSIVQSVSA